MRRLIAPCLLAVLTAVGPPPACAAGVEATSARVVFFVACPELGEAALERMPGVERIDKGFLLGRAMERVWYDSSRITVEDMEARLKDAETYRGTRRE